MTPPRLRDVSWALQYTSDDGDLLGRFYVPALRCAVAYDRATGYFNAAILRLAAEGVEHLIRNGGRMRLVVGCTLSPDEVAAIEKGMTLREAIAAHLAGALPSDVDPPTHDGLELLAWMVARERLDVRVAVPCTPNRTPVPAEGIFHEKAGIITDVASDRLAFNGSVNETAAGWTKNWEAYHVFTSWADAQRVTTEAEKFEQLWSGQAKRVLVVPVPDAVRADLLRFMPAHDQFPRRLRALEEHEAESNAPVNADATRMSHAADVLTPEDGPVIEVAWPEPEERSPEDDARFARVWHCINTAATLEPDGMWVGPATAAVDPWPHQVRAYERLWRSWPPRLLIADEVGLGKTVQAGLLLRQGVLSGRARRVLVMAPKNVLTQWQRELREKFNLHWPIYDGQKLVWPPTPAEPKGRERAVSKTAWMEEPFVLVSSHLVRRSERAADLLSAAPWDLVVLDEAHHARRRGAGGATGAGDKGPNALLSLMRRLTERTSGLVLLTATPMQVHPVEVFDLLQLLGLPPEWSAQAFLGFYETVSEPPTAEGLERLAQLFQSLEAAYGRVDAEFAARAMGGSPFAAKRVLQALRDPAAIPRRQLSPDDRARAYRLLKTQTPVRRLVSRHTRELLRRYYKAGKLATKVADRLVRDDFVEMSAGERAVYEAVEDYISTTYDRAAADERNAVGFVMTIYRRRLASSFAALAATLERRLGMLLATSAGPTPIADDDLNDDELEESSDDPEATAKLEVEALQREEGQELRDLLAQVRALPPDSKLSLLATRLERIRESGYAQMMVFTQYGDTMEFLRDALTTRGWRVMTYAGAGGGVREPDGTWRIIGRDEAKRRFKAGEAEVLVCTDAAAEGLNFQFCGALVNYDMPWNPMRVEQRIGRIDRLGQKFDTIQIVNLHYRDTVETDVYLALRQRIQLFEGVVGKLQPILARLPGAIGGVALKKKGDQNGARSELTRELDEQIAKARANAFDLDEDAVVDFDAPPPPQAPVTLDDLRRVLGNPFLLPNGAEAKALDPRSRAYRVAPSAPEVRVTTSREFFEDYPDSHELWSPGSPVFPVVEVDEIPDGGVASLSQLLG